MVKIGPWEALTVESWFHNNYTPTHVYSVVGCQLRGVVLIIDKTIINLEGGRLLVRSGVSLPWQPS